jgi:hypothetical protein
MSIMNRKIVSNLEFNEIKKNLITSGEKFTFSGTSIKVLDSEKTQYVKSTALKKWIDLKTMRTVRRTDSEIARDVLNDVFPRWEGNYWRNDEIRLLSKPVPHFFEKRYKGNGLYIDITACHAHIYSQLCLSEKTLRIYQNHLSLMPVAAKLWLHKSARNTVVGLMRSTSYKLYNGHRIVDRYYKNKWLNPHLWSIISDIIMKIASDVMRMWECCTWNNDGGLFVSDNPEQTAQQILDYLYEYGFQVSPKNVIVGHIDIVGWNCYSVWGKSFCTHTGTLLSESTGKETASYRNETKRKAATIKQLTKINNVKDYKNDEIINKFKKRRTIVTRNKRCLSDNIADSAIEIYVDAERL